MNIKNLPQYIDLIFCLIVLPVMICIFPVERWAQNFPAYAASVGIWLYALYFINRKFVVPTLIKTDGKSLSGWLLVAASIGISVGFASIDLFYRDYTPFDKGIMSFLPRLKMYQQAVLSLFMVVESFSFFVGFIVAIYQQRLERQQAEAMRDREIITQLRNRIKPHFMFNTLNTLYGLFLTENPAALPSLAKFISMLQYVQRAYGSDTVSLEDELQYIRQYIDLQKLRLNKRTDVRFTVDTEDESYRIPPLLLVTFVENCFKHGVSSVEKSNIDISVYEENGFLTFKTVNGIFGSTEVSSHKGLENCRRRLEIAFSKRHELDITNDGQTYSVILKLKFK